MKRLRFNFFYIPFLIITFSLGVISYRNDVNLKENHIARLTPADKTIATLQGIIITQPEEAITQYKTKRLTFILKASKIKFNHPWCNTTGLVKINIYEPDKEFNYGDEVVLEGYIYPPKAPSNPGQFDYKAYLKRNNIYTLFNVNKNNQIILAGKNKGNFLINLAFKIKNRLNALIETYLPYPQNAVLEALLLGSRQEIPRYLEDKFIQTGTFHILSVSGLHVALVCFILIIFFKAINLPRRIYLILTMILILFYCFLTGARAPIVRSTIMSEIVLLGFLIRREGDIYNSLSLAALLILLKNPQELFEAGFQLSFSAVFSIVYFRPKIEAFFNHPSIIDKVKTKKRDSLTKVKNFFIKSFCVSLAAWIGTLILIVYYFNIFSPITLLANILIVPLTAIIMAGGFTFLIFGIISIPLALIFSSAVEVLMNIFLISIDYFSKMPFAYLRVPSISVFAVMVYFGLLFLIFNYKKLHLSLGKVFIIFILCFNLLVWAAVFKSDNPDLRITFLDVGHGDSIFIEFPHTGNMLIDGGLGGENDLGQWVISPFLWHKGINKIDALILSHPHADHVGGLTTVINNFKIKYAFDNKRETSSWSYKNYKLALKRKNIRPQPLKAGDEISGYPDVQIMVLNPPVVFFKKTASDENNNSLVLKIIFKNTSFLLCADCEEEALRALINSDEDLKADIIKIPHHGSGQGEMGKIFLARVNPRIAVVTLAEYERNLPDAYLINTLREIKANFYSTASSGAITITSDGYKYNLTTMRKSRKKVGNQL